MPAELAEMLLLERDGPGGVRDPLPADDAGGDGQGRRGHRLLPLRAAARLNEVGGDPGRFGISVEQFHAATRSARARFPRDLLATQTHDTKRSGDVRARIGALAWMPAEWEAARFETGWSSPSRCARAARPTTSSGTSSSRRSSAPGRSSSSACSEYMEKALREAKRNTNWIEPNEE